MNNAVEIISILAIGAFIGLAATALFGPLGFGGVMLAAMLVGSLLRKREPWEDDPWRRN